MTHIIKVECLSLLWEQQEGGMPGGQQNLQTGQPESVLKRQLTALQHCTALLCLSTSEFCLLLFPIYPVVFAQELLLLLLLNLSGILKHRCEIRPGGGDCGCPPSWSEPGGGVSRSTGAGQPPGAGLSHLCASDVERKAGMKRRY